MSSRGQGAHVVRGRWGRGALLCSALLISLQALAETQSAHLISDSVEPHSDSNYAKHLFYSNRPSSKTNAVKHASDGSKLYETTYSIDEFRRRVNPFNGKNGKQNQLLFLGCSVTFGEGLSDEQAIPAQVSLLTHDTRTYNYGTNGYGPGNVLSYLRYVDLAKQFPDPKNVSLVFLWGDYLFERQNGSLLHLYWGGKTTPYYALKSGRLEFDGTLADHYWMRAAFANFLFSIPVLSPYLWKLYATAAMQWPSESDVKLNLEILREAAEEYRRQFHNDRFYVAFLPRQLTSRNRMQKALHASGVKTLDLTAAYEGVPIAEDASLIIPKDGHPSPKAAKILAEKIIEGLQLR